MGLVKLASEIYIFAVVLIAIISIPEHTSSAPTETKTIEQNRSFSGDLLQYTKNHSCMFPIPAELETSGSLFNKTDLLCRFEKPDITPSSGPLLSTPIQNLCVGVAQVVERVCNATSKFDSQAMNVKTLNLSLKDDIEAQKTSNVTNFCDRMLRDGPKKSDLHENIQGFYDNFLLKTSGEEDSHCSSVCKNQPSSSLKGDKEFIINPVCLLFKKGYEILRAAEEIKPKAKSEEATKTKEVVPEGGVENTAEAANRVNKKNDPSLPILNHLANDKSDKGSEPSNTVITNTKKTSPTQAEVDPKDANAKMSELTEPESELTSPIDKQQDEVNAHIDSVSGKPKSVSKPELEAEKTGQKGKSSTTSTTPSTGGSANNDEDEDGPPPPLENLDLKSSSPKTKAENWKVSSSRKPSASAEKTKVDKAEDVIEGAGMEDDGDYTGIDKLAPPSNADEKADDKVAGDKTVVSPNDDMTNNMDSPLEAVDKSRKKTDSIGSQQGKLPNDDIETDLDSLQINKEGRTVNINVYSGDSDDNGGFFNYFLFFVTFLGLCFLIFHNKRRLIAYVVEGRNPRVGRTRRRSSSASGASYRKLENNFE